MPRESNSSRDSLSEFFKAGWKSNAVRGALAAACLSAAAFIGKAAHWALTDPWEPAMRLTDAHVDEAVKRSVSNDSRLQNSELAIWKRLVQLDAMLYCPKQTPDERQKCAGVANMGFEFMLRDTSVTPLRTPEQAADATIKQIESGSLLR